MCHSNRVNWGDRFGWQRRTYLLNSNHRFLFILFFARYFHAVFVCAIWLCVVVVNIEFKFGEIFVLCIQFSLHAHTHMHSRKGKCPLANRPRSMYATANFDSFPFRFFFCSKISMLANSIEMSQWLIIFFIMRFWNWTVSGYDRFHTEWRMRDISRLCLLTDSILSRLKCEYTYHLFPFSLEMCRFFLSFFIFYISRT